MKISVFSTRLLFTLMLGCSYAFNTIAFAKEENKERYADPFNVSLFSPAKDYPELYGNYRKNWLRLTGFELSSLHWNQFVAVFINQAPEVYRNNYLEYIKTSQDDYDEDEDEDEETETSQYMNYPIGTMLAKEGFMSHQGKPSDPTFLVVMRKNKPGYDAKYGDWQYFKFATDGTTLLQGNSQNPAVMSECAGCHINVAERDYIFTSFYSANN
jgi:hypothetical protein